MWRELPNDGQIEIYFETVSSTGAPVAPSSAFTTSDFAIYKNGSATAKATTNGLTVTSPFNSETGCHLLVIDTSVDTGDTGWWEVGARYHVKFNTSKTVDSISIDGRSVPRGSFGIQADGVMTRLGTPAGASVSADIAALGGSSGDAEQATSEDILDIVTSNATKLDTIALKAALITAGRIRVLSRVAGSVITVKAGDDHLVTAGNALTLEIDDDDCAIYQFLRDATHTAIKFGAGRGVLRDEITTNISSANITHVTTQTFVPIELASADTTELAAGEYAFDIQVTTAAGHKVTKPQLEGTMFVTADRKS